MFILESRHKGVGKLEQYFSRNVPKYISKRSSHIFSWHWNLKDRAGRWTSISDSVIISSKVAEPYSPK